jgi:hypothetical protein
MAKLTKEQKFKFRSDVKYGYVIGVKALEVLLDEIDALMPVYEAAKRLRDSGYDGPFIGEVCSPLFDAIAEYEREL